MSSAQPSLSRAVRRDNTGQKQNHLFPPGQSGNPNGRPLGSRNKTTLAIESLLDGEAETLTRKAIELAKAGDLVALRLCLDRVCPPRKDRPVTFAMPTLETAADVKRAAFELGFLRAERQAFDWIKARLDGETVPTAPRSERTEPGS
jgi:hypothetical protein